MARTSWTWSKVDSTRSCRTDVASHGITRLRSFSLSKAEDASRIRACGIRADLQGGIYSNGRIHDELQDLLSEASIDLAGDTI